jgi:hypothetical protein
MKKSRTVKMPIHKQKILKFGTAFPAVRYFEVLFSFGTHKSNRSSQKPWSRVANRELEIEMLLAELMGGVTMGNSKVDVYY